MNLLLLKLLNDALMTYESVSKTQADVRKGRISTTERKSMSTKTTIKRIALVAVSALGLGLVTAVAPASAAISAAPLDVTIGTVPASRVGVAVTIPVTIDVTGAAQNDSFTVGVKAISAPAGSAFNLAGASADNVTDSTGLTATGNQIAGSLKLASATGGNATVYKEAALTNAVDNSSHYAPVAASDYVTAVGFVKATASTPGTVKFNVIITPDVAGTYSFYVSTSARTNADATNTGAYKAGDKSATLALTTGGTPTAITVASYAGAVTTNDDSTHGQLFKVTLKDAAGNATVLGVNEALTLSDDQTTTTLANRAGTTITSFAAGDEYLGAYWVRAYGNSSVADGTGILTVTGSGLIPTTVTTQASESLVATTSAPTAGTITCTTSARCVSGSTFNVSGAAALTAGVLATSASADTVHALFFQDKYGQTYSSSLTVAKTATALTTTGTAAFTGPSVDVTYTSATVKLVGATTSGSSGTVTFNYVAPVAKTLSIVGTDTVLSATGGKTTWTIKVVNQYGVAIAYAPVSVSVSGRNTVAATSLGVTDANGFISYSLTDAGTTGTKDTLSFSSSVSGTNTVSGYVNYGTVTVGTVTIKGGNNTTTGVAATTAQWKDINAGVDGASATTHDVIATVKDANGNLVAGVPVTFTVSGTGAAITSTTATVTTGSAGTATAQVYAWVAGTYTVTATAGGKSGTSSYQFRQSAAGEERVLSATVAGNLVTAKVVDRFGNGVPAVKVYASVTGGYLGTGALKSDSTTDNDGLVSFIVNGGASTVTLRTYDSTVAAAVYGSGQTCARAGASDCNAAAADDTAFTASVAGTTTKDEAGVGASFAAAGVSSVEVSVDAAGASDSVDAANEATDAANAATDAANAAAEAADAATAAAQDAQAAVAALATSVASLIAGIKAQITTLTNLVIKIQKKVRA